MTDLHADDLLGIRGLKQAAVVIGVAVGLLASAWGIGYLQGARSGQARSIEAEKQSQEHKGRADAQAEAARKADAQQAQAQADKAKADAEAAKLRALVAKLRAGQGSPSRPGVPEPPVVDDGMAGAAPPDGGLGHGALDEARDALIAAQEAQIAARDREILVLTRARDGWKQAHDDRQRETVSLRLALEGQKAAVSGALWRGRAQGFAVGIASGYLAGRK
jgi:hypothetical protein